MKYSTLTICYLLLAIMSRSQNVGIGTTTPVSKLTIQTSINTTGWTHVGGNDSIIVNEAIGGVAASIGTVTNNAFRIKTNDIGRLHIYPGGEVIVGSNTTPSVGMLTVETPNNSDGISHISTSGNILKTRMGGTTAGIGTFSATDMRIFSGGISRIFISQATGEVSIGTDNTSAGNKLTVQTLNNSFGITHTDGNIRLSTYTGGSTGGGWIGTQSKHPLSFFTNNSGAQMTISTNGSVGIGTFPVASAGLHINHDLEALRLSGSQAYMTFFNGANYKGYLWNKGTDDMELGTAGVNSNGKLMLSIKGTPYLTLQSNGQMSVAGPSAPYLNPDFTVNGTFSMNVAGQSDWALRPSYCPGNGGPCLFVYGTGFERSKVDADGDWIPLSDRSLKENIQEYKPVLEGIKKIQVSTYHFKYNSAGKKSFGLIAQNVADYFPEIVSPFTCNDGKNLLGISYAKTGVLAIKAIQEQQQIIEQQQNKIEFLEKRVAALEKLLIKK